MFFGVSKSILIWFCTQRLLMNRDFVWLVVVVILASNTLLLLSSEDAVDPNLIDIEDLTCSSGEILVKHIINRRIRLH